LTTLFVEFQIICADFELQWNDAERRNAHVKRGSFIFVPFARNDGFVTRDDLFEALDKLLSLDATYHAAAIWGLGGCGKTQIALEYAYRRRKKTSCSIFWVHADNEARFVQHYTDIAKLAGLPPDLKGEDLLRAVQQWMGQQTNWVLVLDNADDLTIFKGSVSVLSEQKHQPRHPNLYRFIPKSSGGTVIWTSRDGGIVGNLVGVNHGIQVGTMTNQESVRLFRSLSQTPTTPEPSENENKLLELLEKLPLAIAQAAAYIRKTKVSVVHYLALLKESEERQSYLLSKEFEDLHRSGVPNSVMHTWLISMGQITRESQCAERVLNTIAFLDNKGLPFELLRAAAGPEYSEDDVLLAAGRLHEYSFLQTQRATSESLPIYEEHRLIQLATRRALNAEQISSFSGKALRIMNEVFPSGEHETWNECKLYLPHSLKAAAWREAESFNKQAPKLLARIGMYYWTEGRSDEAEQLEIEVLKLQKSVLGEKHPDTILAMANLASTWQQQGRSDEAEQLEIEVLELRKSALGERHPDTITAMANLASIRSGQHGTEQLKVKSSNCSEPANTYGRADQPRTSSRLPSRERFKAWKNKIRDTLRS
jgi:tetratricopeptide (TPR) repeat protein